MSVLKEQERHIINNMVSSLDTSKEERYAIVIPALEPGEDVLGYIDELLAQDLYPVIVVDDGSGAGYADLFGCIAQKSHCTVLTHEKNYGKGHAIRTAIKYYMAEVSDCSGIVTVDCDGQHSVRDVMRICQAMHENENKLILGCRDFDESTPTRSRIGNRLTSILMRLLYDIKLSDTQTGLRGLPNALLPWSATLSGERYDYELNMLIYARRHDVEYYVVPIQTLYFDNNSGSHYRTIVDSAHILFRVLRSLLQFGGSAAAAGIVEIAVFVLVTKLLVVGMPLGTRVMFGTMAARCCSSVVNYACNQRIFAAKESKSRGSIVKYLILWLSLMGLSIVAVSGLSYISGIDEVFVKIVIDLVLSVLSYQVQLHWVFSHKKTSI